MTAMVEVTRWQMRFTSPPGKATRLLMGGLRPLYKTRFPSTADSGRLNDQTIKVSIPGSERLMRRGESMLVAAYAATLGAGVTYGRYLTAVGTTDLWVRDGEYSELIEAKSLPDHRYVRQALAQLLDYGPALHEVSTAAAALFPDRPTERGIELLHRYGIDCIYRTGPRSYRREPAPQAARDRLMTFWTH